MNDEDVKRELVIMLAHFIRSKQPEVYEKFATYCDEKKLFPSTCKSLDEALDLRYKHFPANQFQNFIQSLLPKDDYPSIFRRITPFRTPIPVLPFRTVNPIKRIFCHRESIYCLIMDPLGRILVTGADDYKIKLWTLHNLEPICTLSGHENCVTNVCFNPLCTLLLSSSHDKTIRIWSLVDGSCLAVLCDFTTNLVHYATFSPSGSMIAAACEDGTIPIWLTRDALESLSPCRIINTIGKGPAAWIAFSPGGEFISYTCEPSVVVVIALKTMTTFQLELHSSLVGLTTFTSSYFVNGADVAPRLITASNEEGIAAIWEMENFTFKPKYIFKLTGTGRRPTKIQKFAWDVDEHLLVIAKSNGVFVCDTYTGEIVGQLPPVTAFEDCTCIAANPVYREVFFFGNSSGFVAIADICRNEILTEMKCAEDTGFLDAVWSKDGQWIFACDSLGSISTFCTFGPNDSLRKAFPDFILGDLFEDDSNPGIYVDRNGQKVKPQPRKHDLRALDLELMTLQAPYLRNCAIELNLIMKMSAPDRQTITSSTSATIGPPPLHVHISLEYPVNPGGQPHISIQGSSDQEEEESDEQPTIVSDNDNWCFEDEESVKRFFKSNYNPFNDPNCPLFDISNSSSLNSHSDENIGQSSSFSFDNLNNFQKTTSMILSDDLPSGFWPEWATCIACDDNLFIPQVGDEVVLIWSAYMKFIKEAKENILTKTNQKSEKLPEIARCSIQQLTPDEDGMILKLSTPALPSWFTVYFPIPEEVTFLIPLHKFKLAKKVSKSLKVGDKVIVPFVADDDGGIENYTGRITEINPKLMNEPFESIIVDWGHGEKTKISPWEILYLNDTEINYIDNNVRLEGIETGMLSTLDSLNSENKYNALKTIHHSTLTSIYLKNISSPMTLNFLRERLESSYYRSVDAIFYDIQLFQTNAAILNDPGSPSVSVAKDLHSFLKRNLETLSRQYRDRRSPKTK
ncbi:hypothetical protein TRFO_35080 [Tritrichomonas foetus]|uniref:Bromo domain-containing protein n=1 Tax=Tritrichomonas foetus TaxID=1144522 RepID=A0A1J4JH57_9EUKA|nr:hypothetical protein TRFO_35080 [Tritrichomonas foetus]|eukprot:OHS98488.1 hypothetical protein TRFO_35080 [Tritrichomonas foetus]